MKRILSLLILITFFALNLQLKAELATGNSLSGFVRDKETGETLVGASVFLKKTAFGNRTNKSGFFSITNIPQGDFTMVVSYLGYQIFEKPVKFKLNETVKLNIDLNPIKIKSEQVVVTADRDVEKRNISISKVDVPVQQLKEIRIGGEADLFRALQYLPGILTISQISSGLYVRGGSPDQNLILLDGSIVYNPTHLFGFFSTFNTDAIKDVELIKGGFNAEYGGRLSSVLEITQKDGNANKFEGKGSIGAISSRLSLEGPVGNGSWFIGGRRTYLDLIKQFIDDDPENPIPDFGFYDVNAKITQNITENDKVSLSGFLTKDNFSFSGSGIDFNMDVGNQLGALNWTHIFSSDLFSRTNFSYTRYSSGFTGEQSDYYTMFKNSIEDFTLRSEIEWFTNESITHKFGFQTTNRSFAIIQNFTGERDSTSSAATDAAITNINIKDWNHSFFGQVNYLINDLTSIQTGIRFDCWNLKDEFTIDPRLAIRYQLFDNISVKFGWGIYHQNLRLLSDQNFSFFDTWLPSDSTVPISKSNHYILTFETEPINGYDFNFDLYYRTFNGISELNRFALQGTTARDVFFVGNGYSYGFELFAQKKYGKLTGWFGYAYGFVISQFDEINNGKEFNPKYDRRHDMKLVVNYEINDSWVVGANFIFQSGQPYTGATSRVRVGLDGQSYGQNKIVSSDLYGLRLPPSHQLNINATYSFKTFGQPSALILDIYNVYNRRDIWFRFYNTRDDLTTVEDIRLLPIIPSISYEIKF